MESKILFRPDQDVNAQDFIDMEGFIRQSIDDVVKYGIDPGQKYTGLATTQTGTAETTTAVGLFFSSGQVFVGTSPTVFSHIAHLPVSQQVIATVVVWGLEQEEDIQPRAYVIDANANPPVFEPREVTMRSTRAIQISVIYGAESPAPTRGAIPSSVIPVCDILLTTTGISSITMDTTNALVSVAEAQSEIDDLTTWRGQVSQSINTLKSDMAKLAASIPPNLSGMLAAMAAAIAAIQNVLQKPASAVATFVDRFNNLGDSSTGTSTYSARVEDGLTFPASSPTLSGISLLNPSEPRVMTVNNVTLPAYDEVVRLSIRNFVDGHVSIINYPVITLNWVRNHMSRRCVRYGDWLQSAISQPVNAALFSLTGRSVVVDQASAAGLAEIARRPALKYLECQRGGGAEPYTIDWLGFWQKANLSRLIGSRDPGFCLDRYDDAYWPAITSVGSQAGAAIAQSFTNPNNGWMTSVRLFIRDVGPSGDIQVFVCKTGLGGIPDHTQVISTGTLAHGDMVAGRQGVRVPVIPVYLEGGARYTIVLMTNGSHTHYTCTGNLQSFGSLFNRASTNVWVDTGLAVDLAFEIGMASFRNTRAEVQMASATLGGGINALRITAASFQPPGTTLTWQVQNAGIWVDISNNAAAALAGSPTTVPMRAVFQGTSELMPSIDLTQAELEISSTATALIHFSKNRNYGSATTSIKVIYDITGWDAAHHTIDCRLVIGGVTSGVAGTIAHTVNPQDPTQVQYVFTHTVSSTSTIDAIKTIGATSAGNGFFQILDRWDSSF